MNTCTLLLPRAPVKGVESLLRERVLQEYGGTLRIRECVVLVTRGGVALRAATTRVG